MAQLPAFKPSGNGAMTDMENILIAESIAWGAYKQQLIKQLEKTTTKFQFLGHECYANIDMHGNVCTTTDTTKLLELYGFTKEQLAELCDVDNTKDLRFLWLEFGGEILITQETWDGLIFRLQEKLLNVHQIVLHGNYRTYPDTTPQADRVPRYIDEYVMHENIIDDSIRDTPGDEWIKHPTQPGYYRSKHRLINSSGLTFRVNGIQVASPLNYLEEKALKAIMILSEGRFMSANPGKSFTEALVGTNYELQMLHIHTAILNSSALKSMFIPFTEPNPDYPDPNTVEERTIFIQGGLVYNYYEANIWNLREINDNNLFASTNGLFVNAEDRRPHLTVAGLKKVRPEDFGYWMSTLMSIRPILDNGGALASFIGGIMRAFARLANALLGLFLKIPILKQGVEALISWVAKRYNIDFDDARDIVSNLIATIIVTVTVSYVISGFGSTLTTGTTTVAATSTITGTASGFAAGMLSAGSVINGIGYASQMYSLFSNLEMMGMSAQASEEEKQRAIDQALLGKEELTPNTLDLSGTSGSVQEYDAMNQYNYDLQFNQFDIIQQSIESTF